MASFKLQGFNHTGMIVTDLDRAIGFFRDLLGFEVLSRAPRDAALIGRLTGLPGPRIEIAYLQGPGHRVELIRYETNGIRGVDQPRVYAMVLQYLARRRRSHAVLAASAAHGVLPVGEVIAIDAGPNQGRARGLLQSSYGLSLDLIQAGR